MLRYLLEKKVLIAPRYIFFMENGLTFSLSFFMPQQCFSQNKNEGRKELKYKLFV